MCKTSSNNACRFSAQHSLTIETYGQFGGERLSSALLHPPSAQRRRILQRGLMRTLRPSSCAYAHVHSHLPRKRTPHQRRSKQMVGRKVRQPIGKPSRSRNTEYLSNNTVPDLGQINSTHRQVFICVSSLLLAVPTRPIAIAIASPRSGCLAQSPGGWEGCHPANFAAISRYYLPVVRYFLRSSRDSSGYLHRQ